MTTLDTFQSMIAELQKITICEIMKGLDEKGLMTNDLQKAIEMELAERFSDIDTIIRKRKPKKLNANTVKANKEYIKAHFEHNKKVSDVYYKKAAATMKSLRKDDPSMGMQSALRKAVEMIHEQENKTIFEMDDIRSQNDQTGYSSSLNTLSFSDSDSD